MRRAVSVGLAVLALLAVAACDGGSPKQGAKAGSYVAIGDSYVSGPGLGDEDPEVPGCVRSDHNYPHLLVKSLGDLKLDDVSCGGETAEQVLQGRTLTDGQEIGPQTDALTSRTKLVTVGIGANNGNAYLGLFTYCLIPGSASQKACDNFAKSYMPAVFTSIRQEVTEVLRTVHEKSPAAEVVLVGYLRIVPEQQGCDLLPVSAGVLRTARGVETELDTILRDAAQDADVPYVDVRALSAGHDACAGDEAWVNGNATVPDDGTLFHPKRAGMRAVARAVQKVVESD